MSERTPESGAEHEHKTVCASREDEAGKSECASAALSDAQVAGLVRERFRLHAGRALDTVQVTCRHGVVRLSGEIANAELRALALRIADGELDLETIDDLRIAPLPRLWCGRAGQADARSGDEMFDVALLGGESGADIFDVGEADFTFKI